MVFTITRNVEVIEENKGSSFKQYALTFIVSLLFFTHGVESHNLTISVHSGYFKSPDDVPWTTTALILGAIFSSLLHSHLIDIWGRKFARVAAAMTWELSWSLTLLTCCSLPCPLGLSVNAALKYIRSRHDAGVFWCFFSLFFIMVFTITRNVEVIEENKGSSFKQYALTFIVSLLFFTHGVESHNLTISVHSGYFKSPDDVPWTTTALILGAIFSSLLHSHLIDIWGRKFGIYLVILLQGASCIPLLMPPNEIGDILLHVMSGISTAGLFICVPIYIREISTTESRGSMVCLMMVMTSCGYLVKLAISVDNMLYLIAALVLFTFVSLLILLESPSYFVKVGKIERAKTNMAKLRCLSPDELYITNQIKLLTDESQRAKPMGIQRISETLYKNKVHWDEMKVGFMLFTITILGGSIIFLDQDKTLIQLKSSIDPEKYLVPACLTAGAVVSFIFIRIVERKYLLTFAYAVMVVSMGTMAVFTQADLTVTSLRWLPVVAHSVLIFGYGMSWCLPVVIMVEMLNLEIRATVLGIIYTYSQILRLIHVHTLKDLEEIMGVYTLFYVFACINLYGAIYAMSVMPNIKNKSVRQIERQMKRIPIIK